MPHCFAKDKETHCGSECFCAWEGVRQALVPLPYVSHTGQGWASSSSHDH